MTVTSYTDDLYGPIYEEFGVLLTIVLTTNETIRLVGLDKSSGVQVSETQLTLDTIRPAAVIRLHDLLELGHSADDLMDALMDMNSVSWVIKSYFPKASPRGEMDGELYLILQEAP